MRPRSAESQLPASDSPKEAPHCWGDSFQALSSMAHGDQTGPNSAALTCRTMPSRSRAERDSASAITSPRSSSAPAASSCTLSVGIAGLCTTQNAIENQTSIEALAELS